MPDLERDGDPPRAPDSGGADPLLAEQLPWEDRHVDRFEAAAALLADHQLTHHTKIVAADRHGQRKRFWVTCSCGYATEPGKSWRYTVGAGVGHVQRVADKMRAEGQLTREAELPRRVNVPNPRKRRTPPVAS